MTAVLPILFVASALGGLGFLLLYLALDQKRRLERRARRARFARVRESERDRWDVFARDRGLAIRITPSPEGSWHQIALAGEIDALKIRLDLPGDGMDAETRCTLRVALPRPLPEGALVSRRQGPGGARTGDPVMDAALTVQGDPTLPALLRREGVREALLPLVHGWPGSRLEAGQLVIQRPLTRMVGAGAALHAAPDVEALEETIADAARLIRLLVED